MKDQIVTMDLSRFEYRNIDLAVDLLKAYKIQGADFLGDGITLNLNTNSGFVFLSDEDFNVGMMNGDKLEKWFNCPVCGHEGFKEDMKHREDNEECKQYLHDIGVLEG